MGVCLERLEEARAEAFRVSSRKIFLKPSPRFAKLSGLYEIPLSKRLGLIKIEVFLTLLVALIGKRGAGNIGEVLS